VTVYRKALYTVVSKLEHGAFFALALELWQRTIAGNRGDVQFIVCYTLIVATIAYMCTNVVRRADGPRLKEYGTSAPTRSYIQFELPFICKLCRNTIKKVGALALLWCAYVCVCVHPISRVLDTEPDAQSFCLQRAFGTARAHNRRSGTVRRQGLQIYRIGRTDSGNGRTEWFQRAGCKVIAMQLQSHCKNRHKKEWRVRLGSRQNLQMRSWSCWCK
jgi:hypothetical protein